MNRDIVYNKILTERSSFQLVRTNPKLTGNVKLTVSESGEMWLNAIPANLELSKNDYSRFPIDINHSLASNIFQFFKAGATPSEIIFSLTERVDLEKTSNDLKDQYDFSNYFSGAKYLVSNKYDQRLSYFAPIHLEQDLPDYFVIFKITDPINDPIDVSKQKYESGQSKTDYIIDLFKKASIIKTFDLGEDSIPGAYIRRYINDVNFPISPLSVSFDERQETRWHGIVVESGVLGFKGEYLYDFYQQSNPLKFFESEITAGFERNGVIYPNILNLEFIFNDETSELYEINRYVGLYVNAIELSKLDIDLSRMYAERINWPNSPRLKREYFEDESTVLSQTNQEGVIIPYKNSEINFSEFTDIISDSESIYFNYITDKYGKFSSPKFIDPYSIDYADPIELQLASSGTLVTATAISHGYATDDLIKIESADLDYAGEFFITKLTNDQFTYSLSQIPVSLATTATGRKELRSGKLTLGDTRVDVARYFGPQLTQYLQDDGFTTNLAGNSHAVIKLNGELSELDELKIYHPRGSRSDVNGKFELITISNSYALIPTAGDFYAYNDFDGVAGQDTFYVNGTGTVSIIAKAISECINRFQNRTLTAFAFNEYIFIKCNVPGDFDNSYSIQFNSPLGEYSSIEIEDIRGTQLISNNIKFQGGSKPSGNRLVIDREHFSRIEEKLSDLLVKTTLGWSKIKKVSTYVDSVNQKSALSDSSKISAISDYLTKMVVTLEKSEPAEIKYGKFLMHRKFRPGFGLLSMFPIKDLDFDFYLSTYSNFPEIDLYQNYFVPADRDLLQAGIEYQVIGGSIQFDGFTYNDGDTFTVGTSTSFSYSILSGNPIVTYYSDFSAGATLLHPILDQNLELKDFPGFSILKDPSKVVPSSTAPKFELSDKFFNGQTLTEYDFFKENQNIDFATVSKIVPFITKWAIKNGIDSRDNPYRLNVELPFGRNNFSPDHTDRTQNPDNFTHEWFYIESRFNYLDDEQASKLNSYYFDTPLDEARLLSDPDYFIEYFTYTPKFGENQYGDPIDIAPTQFRYSNVFKNEAGQYEAFFKGFKITFNDVTDATVIGENGKPVAADQTDRFEDYSFSCILKPVKENFYDQTQPPIKYRVIEHRDHKFILIVIELAIGHLSSINDYWYNSPFTAEPEKIGTSLNSLQSNEIFYLDNSFASEFGTDLPFETVLGDYRVEFDQIDGKDISNLSHVMLYSLKHKKFNSILDNFSTVKLVSKLNLTQAITNNTLSRVDNEFLLNYPSSLTDTIIKAGLDKQRTIIGMNYLTIDTNYFIDQSSGITVQNNNPIEDSAQEFVTFNLDAGNSLVLSTELSTAPYSIIFQAIPLSSAFTNIIKNDCLFFAVSGGENYFEKLFEKLSFAKFKKYVNDFDPFIEYESYSVDSNGNSVLLSNPDFYMEIEDQSIIEKTSQIINLNDDDLPSQISFKKGAAFNFERANLTRNYEINRYKGNYEPVFKDLLHCRSSFNFHKNKINPLTLSNTRINTNIDTLLTIENFNHIKVSDTKILNLESDANYSPLYPEIGEIAINQAPYFLFSGNWDWGFHLKYSDKFNYERVAGSLRVEEDESFVAKLINVPANIDLEKFTISSLAQNQKLERANVNQIELLVKENNTTVNGVINLENAIISYFLDNQISQKFNEYLINSSEYIGNFQSLEDYVKAYIKQNLLKLYEIEEIEFYQKLDRTLASTQQLTNENPVSFVSLNDSQRAQQGFTRIKTVGINKKDRLIVNFEFAKNVDSGIIVSPKVKIKFI